ncbi:ParM/StbA family protein [Leptolyngbya ohadii]|uniref:ParM/StbA family protein n=1 Tax=Leptolyngbya ohadii TaxID=1962290 RepID=UPI000B5A0EA8|nr:hypothetical protein [Leptolyngbya ohadii]
MVLTIPERPATGRTAQLIPVGFDGGNGNTKVVIEDAEIRLPAYVLPIHGELYDVPSPVNGGYVEYVSGDRPDMEGQRWMAGYPAYQYSPFGCLRVVDDRKGKIKFGLQLLLGSIATLPYRPFWHLGVMASIQDAQALGDELAQALKGGHNVRFNGSKQLSTVMVTVLQVVEEGVGAVFSARHQIDPNGQNLLYDFGSGTCIISVFGAKGKLTDRKVHPAGVESLIDAIARNLEMRQQQLAEGDRQIIRAGIERADFEYGRTGWNFRHIYNYELKPWVSSVLAPVIKTAEPWTPTSTAILAIGGGSQLPTIAQLLLSRGITPIAEGTWANARGMRDIATLKLQGV